ncbi:MAG TPA: DUF4349 domain-containing protein [Myxococcota bacterium]|nr:DUF4349 domain-containing protein [Myxococcota bacterium]
MRSTWPILLLLALGCARRMAYAPAAEPGGGYGGYAADMDYAPAPPPPPPAPMMAGRSKMAMDAPSMPAEAAPATAPPPTEGQAQRMVHYSGYARIQVARPADTVDQLSALVKEAGGYVENLSGNSLTLRVPEAQFQRVYEQILLTGTVLQRSMSAEDVTEAFTAIDLRLSSSKARQARLIQLLAQAKSEEEKIILVQQLTEVSEQIDQLEAQLRTLRRLADYSRITVELQERVPLSGGPAADESLAFTWISQLNPFSRGVESVGAPVALSVPEGLVQLSRRPFVAESADGTRIWTTRLPNEPRGDAAWWLEAVRSRMERDFAKAELRSVGEWQLLRLVGPNEPAYRYLIGVRTDGKSLELVEVYFPTKEQEERYGKAIDAVLTGDAVVATEGQ